MPCVSLAFTPWLSRILFGMLVHFTMWCRIIVPSNVLNDFDQRKTSEVAFYARHELFSTVSNIESIDCEK